MPVAPLLERQVDSQWFGGVKCHGHATPHVLFNGIAMCLGDLQYLKFLKSFESELLDGVLESGSKRKWMAACYRSIESIGIFGCCGKLFRVV